MGCINAYMNIRFKTFNILPRFCNNFKSIKEFCNIYFQKNISHQKISISIYIETSANNINRQWHTQLICRFVDIYGSMENEKTKYIHENVCN